MTNGHSTGTKLHVEASARVHGPGAEVYRMIADYRSGHPRIVPPKYFRDLRVVAGGYGDGTAIEFDVLAFGKVMHFRASVTEPEPGRVLEERNLNDGSVTRFIVEPAGSSTSRVTIASDRPLERTGVLGWFEGALTRTFLRRIYAQQLARLDEQVQLDLQRAASEAVGASGLDSGERAAAE